MTYEDALSYLGLSRRFGMKLGLDSMRELARRLGNPQDNLRFIHLAGTNGKGSTAAFCESCLRAAGFRVGLYTSPHLVSVRERIQIDRRPISERDFALGMEVVRGAIEDMKDSAITFFEITTALALWYFARESVEWAVWETGLGGRLDATNIVEPKICIITNIGLDHQQYLGESLLKIGAEKAGIIKPGVPVISGVEEGEAADVIRARAKAENCVLTLTQGETEMKNLGLRGGKQWAEIDGNEYALGLIGSHQISNAACALEAMWQLRSSLVQDNWEHVELDAISDDDMARGLAETVWPGRFQILSESPLIVLDGAHNPAGVKALVETWRAYVAARFGWNEDETDAKAHLVFASVADKEISEMARLLRPLARNVSLVRLANERSAEPAQLAELFSGVTSACYDSVAAVWRELVNAPAESMTLVTGSLFLVGEMLAQQQDNAEEYQLNERLETFTTAAKI